MTSLNRYDYAGLGTFCLIYLTLGLSAMPPGIVPGDGAELIYGIQTFQTVHAPGYPLYRLLGAGLNVLSPHPAPVNAHFLSLLFTVLSLAVLYLVQRRIGITRLTSFATLAVLGFSYPIWTLSVQVEVYSLALFFFAGTILLYRFVAEESSHRRTLWFWAGLSLTHHPIGLLNVALALYGTYRDAEPVRPSEVLLFVSPALLYGLLFWPSSAFPFNWTQIGTVDAFLHHVLGGGMTGFFLESGLGTLPKQFHRLTLAHLSVFPLLVLPVLAVGYLRLVRELKPLVVLQLILLVVLLGYEIPDVGDFLVPSYLIGALVLGVGLDRFRRRSTRFYGIVLAGCLASVVGFAYLADAEYDRSDYRFPERYARSADAVLGEGVVLGDWAHYTLLRYYQLRRGYLPDVQLLTLAPGSDAWGFLVRSHHRRGTTVHTTFGDREPPDGFELVPTGYLFRVSPIPAD